MTNNGAHIIVFGNEKGGSGKSTTAMHTAIALLRLGYRVGTVDLDARQGSLTRYMKNRWAYIQREKHNIPCPIHMDIEQSRAHNVAGRNREEQDFLFMALTEMGRECDFVVVDTPGSDTNLNRMAHGRADTLVTPLNDSFVDLDVLGRINPETHEITGPSIYTLMVEEKNIEKIERGQTPIHWIVVRNRMSHLNARNKQEVAGILEKMSVTFGFQLAAGFSERVIFRELFLKGLTLLDLKEDEGYKLSVSEITARQEVRSLIRAIAPEKIKGYANKGTRLPAA